MRTLIYGTARLRVKLSDVSSKVKNDAARRSLPV